ncbi:DUF930 domain-containing protein [Rhizobium grahamii]|uniref:DUF930 domain-containing protein n=1 Tax=Rhizobium grahamii TaxID=1120045 RepID=A0A5Q0CAL1_9HYPH|nr:MULTISPECIES: DUF930 domain-containing protein [Rhizobium]QFY60719.1 DUF930 domain-containing protein [Rhizobium grahamii]QRM50142.1 DUF930 domain-containing protein [Rhizobium sp. BG6]
MPRIPKRHWGVFGWGIVASVLLHLVVVGAFFLKLPDMPQPVEEEAVSVDLVPPPEEKKPEEPKPEEKPPELKMPDEKQEEKKAEENKAEEKKLEEKPAEPPPPPPPPPPPEKKPEEKPPEEKPAAEPPKAEEPKPEGKEAGGAQPLQPLRPVFQFGDKDTGPEKTETGNASASSGKPNPTPSDKPPELKPEAAAKADAPPSDKPPAKPVPDDIALPEVATAETHIANNAPAAADNPDVKTTMGPQNEADAGATEADKAGTDELTEAKTLFSQKTTNDPVAKTAIDGLPRGMRVAQLCSTELREQLIHAPQRYRPELLPSYRLSQGTVLEVKRGAFRASARWYDMSFRCEVDADATKVVSFAFDVGDVVPKSQWKSRGFPSY